MKVVIFGATGMLGYYVFRTLRPKYNVIAITKDDYDIESNDLNKLTKIIDNTDIIINCSGIIPQKANKNNIKSYLRVNSMFPQLLCKLQHIYRYKLIHITTDCVFDGKYGDYNEYSSHDSKDIYGISKSLGESLDATVIRTSIIGEELFSKKNLLEWIKTKQHKKINGFVNHYWNGITSLTLANYIDHIITTNCLWKGVRHLFSPQKYSKYELCKYISQAYDLGVDVVPVYHEQTKDLTLSSIYQSDFTFPDIQEQLIELKDFEYYEMGDYKILDKCRFCDNPNLESIIKFNNGALAGGFIKLKRDALEEKIYPLTLVYCNNCNTCLCKEVIHANSLFTNINNQNYYYYSSTIPDLVKHFTDLSQKIKTIVKNTDNPKICEIGCNDGVLLNNLSDLQCIGIDPSSTIKNITNRNITTYNTFFNTATVDDILTKHGKQNIIVACNCLAHIDNISEIYRNIKRLLADDGTVIIEVHYMKKVVDNLNFDFIYHEHMSYYTVNTFVGLGKKYNFSIEAVEEIKTHGGSIRVYLKHGTDHNPSINHFLDKEKNIKYEITSLFQIVKDWKQQLEPYYSDKMIGYGASGRTNTIINYLNQNFHMIFDDSKYKIGTYLPYFHTPIISSQYLNAQEHPIIFILAWPYTEAIVRKHENFIKQGGTFIIILPEIKVINNLSIIE